MSTSQRFVNDTMGQRKKTYKGFIKDLVFNNPRADRQMPLDGYSKYVKNNRMLYDNLKTKKA